MAPNSTKFAVSFPLSAVPFSGVRRYRDKGHLKAGRNSTKRLRESAGKTSHIRDATYFFPGSGTFANLVGSHRPNWIGSVPGLVVFGRLSYRLQQWNDRYPSVRVPTGSCLAGDPRINLEFWYTAYPATRDLGHKAHQAHRRQRSERIETRKS